MEHLDMSAEAAPDPAVGLAGLTDLEMRTLACRTELATLFRAIQGVAGLTATNLETGGSLQELTAFFVTLGQLDQRASDEAGRFGALLSSVGSA
ncbi:hypothetical protein [Methylobacterium brachiatum]